VAKARTVAERQVLDIERGGLPTLLRYEDRNSMANSIESRVPFLDHLLVEWAVRLPTGLKLRDGYGKWILRQAAEGLVPPAVLNPRGKRGFDVDGAAWMGAGLGAQVRAELTRVAPRLQDAGIRVHRSGNGFSDRDLARPGGALASAVAAIWVGRTLE
jgi:asparagine synthase (glutamine-hydrolysing)